MCGAPRRHGKTAGFTLPMLEASPAMGPMPANGALLAVTTTSRTGRPKVAEAVRVITA